MRLELAKRDQSSWWRPPPQLPPSAPSSSALKLQINEVRVGWKSWLKEPSYLGLMFKTDQLLNDLMCFLSQLIFSPVLTNVSPVLPYSLCFLCLMCFLYCLMCFLSRLMCFLSQTYVFPVTPELFSVSTDVLLVSPDLHSCLCWCAFLSHLMCIYSFSSEMFVFLNLHDFFPVSIDMLSCFTSYVLLSHLMFFCLTWGISCLT